MRRLLVAGLSLLLLSACGVTPINNGAAPAGDVAPPGQVTSGNIAPAGRTVASYFSPPQAYPGSAWAKDGRAVTGRELNSIAGPDHCGWESAAIMHLGWPLGTVSDTSAQIRQFIRDPGGVIGPSFREKLVLQASLPADATATGYRQGDLELWLSPSNDDTAYLRVGNDVEQWPRAVEIVACK